MAWNDVLLIHMLAGGLPDPIFTWFQGGVGMGGVMLTLMLTSKTGTLRCRVGSGWGGAMYIMLAFKTGARQVVGLGQGGVM